METNTTVTKDTTYRKIDEKTIEITETNTTVDVTVRKLTLTDLIDQKAAKEVELKNYVEMRQKEIDDKDKAIERAVGFGITPMVSLAEEIQ